MTYILTALAYAAPGVALAAFVVAAFSAIAMVRHREPGVTRWHLATHGIDFYSGKGFSPSAAPYRRRFLLAAGIFFAAVLVGAASGIALQAVTAPP